MTAPPTSAPLTILFVDDEPQTLRGLQRVIHGAGRNWQVALAGDGAMALDLMDRQRIDVIVTDLRMPGLDGQSLLAEIARRHPETLRIVLTGGTDPKSMMRVVASSHAVLTKPCAGDLLVGRIARAVGLRQFMNDAGARALVSGLGHLPTLPRTYLDLHAEMERDRPSESRIVAIIEADPPVDAQLLHVANSSYFAPRVPIQRTLAAVRALGLDIVRALVLERGIIAQFDPASLPPAFDTTALWSHSFKVAALARAIAEADDAPTTERDAAFTAGLLHDLGWLIIAANRPQVYQSCAEAERAGLTTAERADLERRHLGATHAEFGAYLLGLWGLPDRIVEAVAYHHDPLHHAGTAAGCDGALLAVHAANALIEADGKERLRAFDPGLMESAEVARHLPRWMEAAATLRG